MTLEAKIDRTNELLEALLASFQSGAQMADAAAPAEKKTRAKKGDAAATSTPTNTLGLVDGDPEGTRYWESAEHHQVYAQLPGQPDPQDQSFKIVTAARYLLAKDVIAAETAAYAAEAGKAPAAATTPVTATPTPTATAPAATASAPTSAVDWKADVFPAIQALNKALGADAIRGLIQHFGLQPKTADNPNGATVPSLETLGKHADVRDVALKMAAGESLTATVDDLGL